MAVFAWEHMMREQAAYHWMVTGCNASEGDRSDSHWRQPWTPVSATLVTEMADQKSLHWACNRHISKVRFFPLLVWRNQHHVLSLTAGFIPCHGGITWASSMIFSEPSGSIPCVASLAITWVNLPTVGGQPTQMYQSKQWACNRHSVHGRTEFYRTNWTVAHGELFHRRQGLLLDYSGMEGASSRFLIESSGLWKQELWHWVMWDIYEWYLLHHRGAVLRGMGTFLKA